MSLALLLVACNADPIVVSASHAVSREGHVSLSLSSHRRDSGDAVDLCGAHTTIEVSTRAGGLWEDASNVEADCTEPPLVDAVLVADNSGSEVEHLVDIQDALEGFAHRMLARNHDDRLGLVRVSTESSVVLEPTAHEGTIDAAIGGLFINEGWTALWDGVRLANELMEDATVVEEGASFCYSGAYPTVLVFTDGQENNSADEHDTIYDGDGVDTTEEDLYELAAAGIPTVVHTVGVGPDIDEAALERVAEATGGTYRAVANYGGLTGELHAAAAQISTQVPTCFVPAAPDHDEARIVVTYQERGATEIAEVVAPIP